MFSPSIEVSINRHVSDVASVKQQRCISHFVLQIELLLTEYPLSPARLQATAATVWAMLTKVRTECCYVKHRLFMCFCTIPGHSAAAASYLSFCHVTLRLMQPACSHCGFVGLVYAIWYFLCMFKGIYIQSVRSSLLSHQVYAARVLSHVVMLCYTLF